MKKKNQKWRLAVSALSNYHFDVNLSLNMRQRNLHARNLLIIEINQALRCAFTVCSFLLSFHLRFYMHFCLFFLLFAMILNTSATFSMKRNSAQGENRIKLKTEQKVNGLAVIQTEHFFLFFFRFWIRRYRRRNRIWF